MTLDEFTALVVEDISKFEDLTHIQLTADDLRIISMNRFASLERSLDRSLTGEEYRQLLQTRAPHLVIERDLLRRPLTLEERIELEELTMSPSRDLLSTDRQRIQPTRTQLDDVSVITVACSLGYVLIN